jgi:hypothetical protein
LIKIEKSMKVVENYIDLKIVFLKDCGVDFIK